MKFVVLALIFSLSFPVRAASSDEACFDSFSALSTQSVFDSESFKRMRTRYRRYFAGRDFRPLTEKMAPRTIEEKTAFLEAVLEKRGAAAAGKAPQKKLRLLLDNTDFLQGIIKGDVDKIVSQYYLASLGNPAGLLSLVRNGIKPETVDKLIWLKFNRELANEGLDEAFKKMQILRPESGILEKTKALLEENKNTLNNIIFGMQAIGTYNGLRVDLLLLPLVAPKFTKKIITPRLLEIVREQGVKAAWPIIRKEAASAAEAELYYSLFSRAYVGLACSTFAYFIWQEIKTGYGIALQKNQKVTEQVNEITNMKSLLDNWEEEYFHNNGHAPSAKEWNRIKLYLNKTRNEKKIGGSPSANLP